MKQVLARVEQDSQQVGLLDEPPGTGTLLGTDAERRDDQVSLVALEAVHGPEPQIHRHQVVSGEGGQDGELDGIGLGPKWCDHPHTASPALAQLHELDDDGVNLGRHDALLVAAPVVCSTSMQSLASVIGDRVAT